MRLHRLAARPDRIDRYLQPPIWRAREDMMRDSAEVLLVRWRDAGLIDEQQLDAIRLLESQRPGAAAPSQLPLFAMAGGAIMLMAGIFLFVAAHWDELSRWSRFSIVLLVLAVVHVAALLLRERHQALAATLHGLGTASLGAGIFLCGQIFNMSGDLAGALLLWSAGAAAAWFALRDWIQTAFLALLIPAYLIETWTQLAPHALGFSDVMLPAMLLMVLDFVYLAGPMLQGEDRRLSAPARALGIIGALAVVPIAVFLAVQQPSGVGFRYLFDSRPEPSALIESAAFAVAFLVPLSLSIALGRRGVELIALLLWSLWTLVTAIICWGDHNGIGVYLAFAVGAALFVFFGVRQQRSAMVNVGVAGFSVTVLVFYFSNVFDKLGRSAGLIGLGITLLAVGVLGERARRKMLASFARGVA